MPSSVTNSQEHPNTTAVTEAPLLGVWTEAPHAKKTDLAPPTPPAETEAPLVRAGSETPKENMTGLAPPTLTLTAGTEAPLEFS